MVNSQATLPVLSTERLALRPASASDLDILIGLNSDPAVMAYILGRAATAAETAEEWEQRLAKKSNPEVGLGYWLGFEDGHFIGWWSASWFAPRPNSSGIGYRLHASAWGRGLATEGADAMIAQAFSVPSVDSVFASTMAVNAASRRVLEKLGMTHVRSWTEKWEEPIPGAEHGEVGYELRRN